MTDNYVYIVVFVTLFLLAKVVKKRKFNTKYRKGYSDHENIRTKTSHVENVTNSKSILRKIAPMQEKAIFNYLRGLDPYYFEEIILTGFEFQGFQVVRNSSYSGDGGIDGKVIFNSKVYVVQSKKYGYKKYINPIHVEEFSNVAKNYDGGFFVHCGKTGLKSLKSKRRVVIISGSDLISFLRLRYPFHEKMN